MKRKDATVDTPLLRALRIKAIASYFGGPHDEETIAKNFEIPLPIVQWVKTGVLPKEGK